MKLLSLARNLRRRRGREREDAFVAEGVRSVEELLRSPIRVLGVLAATSVSGAPRAAAVIAEAARRGVPVEHVDDADFASAADTESPQGVLAIGEVPRFTDWSPAADVPLRILVLDAVQDPGNVGTMLRTAAALGVAATVALPGTVDLWNAKVVRSAMGAHFHHPAFPRTLDELGGFLAAERTTLWAAAVDGRSVGRDAPPQRLAVAVGNEGAGITPGVRTLADALVSIPIVPTAESLNVAVAAGILLHQLRP